MASAASQVLQRHNAELVTAISAGDLLSLTLKLYGEGLIERETKDDVYLLTHTPLQKACIIVSAVERKMEADPSLFHQFTALLQEEGDSLKAISKSLLEKYRSLPEKELGPSTLPPHHTPHQPSPPQPHSPLCLYADHLRTLYTQSELPKYSNPACYKWTPSPSKEYIDLSTIDRKGMTGYSSYSSWLGSMSPVSEMQVSQEELAREQVPLNMRDYCAHLFIPLTKCRKDNYYLPWKCKKEKHAWEDCQFQDYLDRVRQKRAQ